MTGTEAPRLAIREIHGHATLSTDKVYLWYRLAPQRWSFLSDAQRLGAIDSFGYRCAALGARRIHLRGTTRPYPTYEWAKALNDASPNALPGWAEHLKVTQDAIRKTTLSEKVVFVGVEFSSRSWFARLRASLTGVPGGRGPELEARARDIRTIDEIMTGGGAAEQATTAELEWLIHRSVRLGLPSPAALSMDTGDWRSEDIPSLTDGVSYTYSPFSPTVQITADYDGTEVTRHVAVLTVGRMGALDVPQTNRSPWMQHTDRFGFPVDWSAIVDIVPGTDVAEKTAKKRLLIRDQQKQYHLHGLDEPLDLQRRADHALRIEDETLDGSMIRSTRAYGWFRMAVSARDEDECRSRVQDVIRSYRERQQIDVHHPHHPGAGATQRALLGEFLPGADVSTTAYRRDLPVRYFAAGMPHVTSRVGDSRGSFYGYTIGESRSGFTFDPFYSMEVYESAGLIPIVGGLGSGKSVVLGSLAYETTMRGIVTTVFDPSGPLAKLTKVPALAKHARHVDLMDGADGTLNPYRVIPDPRPENCLGPDGKPSEKEYVRAIAAAKQNRKMLATDVLRGLLPPQVDRLPDTPLMIQDAISKVGGERTASLDEVLRAFGRTDRRTKVGQIRRYLEEMRDMPQARLFFGTGEDDNVDQFTDTLLVLTMTGIVLPSETQAPEDWSTAEQLSVPLLNLASHYATARAYGLPRNQRKMVELDEARMVGAWGSGRALFTRLGVDSRKWNLAVPIASQNPNDVLDMNVRNYLATAFVGRIEDETLAREALEMLRVPTGVGYEQAVMNLSPHAVVGNRLRRGPREFIVKDPLNNVEKVRIDRSHLPEVIAALDTTPDEKKAAAA